MNLLVIGANPSESSPDDSAFHPSTKSRKIIDSWLKQMNMPLNIIYLNVCNYKTPNNRSLSQTEIANGIKNLMLEIEKYISTEDCKIITVGNVADEAVYKLKLEHFKCPHPSGRNRQLNSSVFVEDMIDKMRKYLGKNLEL